MTVYINGVAQVGDGDVGGLYGINVETLTGDDKTLTPGTDKIYQYLDEGDASRIVTLATIGATAGDRFVIRHNGTYNDTHFINVKQGEVSLHEIRPGVITEFIFDGTNWIAARVGTGEVDLKYSSIVIGKDARGDEYGVAVGYEAYGQNRGVAVGAIARGNDYGVAIGFNSKTNNKKYSIALGVYSQAWRYGETSINIGGDTDQENNAVQGRWEGQVAGGAGATEIFCAGQANERYTIRPSSVLAFDMIIVARDNVANEVARYSVHDGLIKRDAANNTVMVNCTVTVDHEDDAGWDCAVTADDGNEALIITVTGDDTNITQWAAVMNGLETHF